MTRYALTSAVLLLSLAASTFAQANQPSKQPSVWVGTALQLGMPRDAIITKLSENYTVTKVKNEDDDWFVADKNDPLIWQGYLGFHGGKLTYASRSWTQGDEDNYAFAQALWGGHVPDGDGRPARLLLRRSNDPFANCGDTIC